MFIDTYITLFVIICLIFASQPANSSVNCEKKNFIIGIDAGHSKQKPGATSSIGLGEYYYNIQVAKVLHETLKNGGFINSFIINKNGHDIELKYRSKLANEQNADVLISIHHDSVQKIYLKTWYPNGNKRLFSNRFRGFSIFVSNKNIFVDDSTKLANLIGAELVENSLQPSLHHAENIKGEKRELLSQENGVYRFDDLVILKNATMPAVLLECGIIVNRNEEIQLRDPSYRKKITDSVAKAIEKFCSEHN